jgi:hypothetical protein
LRTLGGEFNIVTLLAEIRGHPHASSPHEDYPGPRFLEVQTD